MNEQQFSAAMSQLNSEYIDEALRYRGRKPGSLWRKLSAVAACLLLLVGVGLLLPLNKVEQDPTPALQIVTFNNAYYEICDDATVLTRLGLPAHLSAEDAGAEVAFLSKTITDTATSYQLSEQRTDIVIYNYAHSPGEAVYVVDDNGDYAALLFCNYLREDSEQVPLRELYQTYGVASAAELASLSVVEDRGSARPSGTVVTDPQLLEEFYTLSSQLADFSVNEYHDLNYGGYASEEELLEAYETTSEQTITLMLETVYGLRLWLKYDAGSGWLEAPGAMRYYQADEAFANWLEANID